MPIKTKIIFLGTSAQIPTRKRNHTGILISYDAENILVDCGEGIQRQFRVAKLNPCKVTKILLTHKHGDHIFGLPGFLSTLSFSGYNKTLCIYGPKGIKKFLEDFLKLVNIVINFKIEIKEVDGKFFENNDFYLESEKMQHGVFVNAYNFVIKDKLRIDKKKIEKAKLPSGPIVKDLKNGKDIVYEGKKFRAKDFTYEEKGKKVSVVLDTLDNEKIIPFVKDADVLITEACYGSDLTDTAIERFHMTSEQCGKIAKKGKVGKLLLTHVSPRYDTNKKFVLDDAKKNFKNVKLVNDFDEVDV